LTSREHFGALAHQPDAAALAMHLCGISARVSEGVSSL
jgi:hypothetical protein